ncbi:MAG: hypothetical protein GC137_07180 [Alphaproteobacteria bacterium]|nr:hypothetical protein [Alphaproteobacteria bacterium]
MHYKQHTHTRQKVLSFFQEREKDFPGVAAALQRYFEMPTLTHAREATRLYAHAHQQGHLDPLNMFALAFAEKRLTIGLVDFILDDSKALDYIAKRSYPHPIGFDKLVLYHDPDTGFKFRLHIYWRGNQRLAMERTHLHRFEMASAIITGELTNHEWETIGTELESDFISGMEATPSKNDPTLEQKRMAAYTGYWRDPDGILHKQFLGHTLMERAGSETHVSGKSYAQELNMAHYVETNAENGNGNGDVCSTIYIHSGGEIDGAGRRIPILLEDYILAAFDQVIDPIPNLTTEVLRESLKKYRDLVEQSVEFYDWLYDPRHGRNLSVGMIAGYLLSDSYSDPHIIKKWIEQEGECKKTLEEYSENLGRLIRGEVLLSDISDDDRKKRYYALLLDKADRHEGGRADWYAQYGNLVKEMWRYCGAIKGEKPGVTVLKPIWEKVVGQKMPGGAHYGHIAAMIEAAYQAKVIINKYKEADLGVTYKPDDSPVSLTDKETEQAIRAILKSYYPAYGFKGEESPYTKNGDRQEGRKRWLVDPIDGTLNFINGSDNYAVSIACQEFKNGAWVTTDGLVSIPSTGKIFWAEKDRGAYLIERDDKERPLTIVDDPAENTLVTLKNKVIDLSITGLGIDAEAALIHDIRSQGGRYRTTGSVAITLAQAAGMGNHGVVITAHDYDIEAGKLIAMEAGASISTMPLPGTTQQLVVAGENQELQEILLGNVLKGRSLQVGKEPPPPGPAVR